MYGMTRMQLSVKQCNNQQMSFLRRTVAMLYMYATNPGRVVVESAGSNWSIDYSRCEQGGMGRTAVHKPIAPFVWKL